LTDHREELVSLGLSQKAHPINKRKRDLISFVEK
jgi:hypothetical protein